MAWLRKPFILTRNWAGVSSDRELYETGSAGQMDTVRGGSADPMERNEKVTESERRNIYDIRGTIGICCTHGHLGLQATRHRRPTESIWVVLVLDETPLCR
jgi:hypothetical protein